MATTTRLALRYPILSDTADVPRDIGNLASDIDKAAIFSAGVLASRPTSTGGSPGIAGRFYHATDAGVDKGDLWFDYGTGYRKAALFGTAGGMLFGSATVESASAPQPSSGTYIAAGGTLAFTKTTGAQVVINAGVGSETNFRYSVDNDGKMQWGPGGATAQDTALSRGTAGLLDLTKNGGWSGAQLRTGIVQVDTGGVGDRLYFGASTDAYIAKYTTGTLAVTSHLRIAGGLSIDVGGGGNQLTFGSSGDAYQYRLAAGVMGFGSNIVLDSNVNRSIGFIDNSGGYGAFRRNATSGNGELLSQASLILAAGPSSKIYFANHSGGTIGTVDSANIYRSGANQITTDGALVIKGNTVNQFQFASDIFSFYASGEANPRFQWDYSGQYFGAGGASATDIRVARSAAGELTIFGVNGTPTGNLKATGNLYVTGASGSAFVARGKTNNTVPLLVGNLSGDTTDRVILYTDRIDFGPGGVSTYDTRIVREAAQTVGLGDTGTWNKLRIHTATSAIVMDVFRGSEAQAVFYMDWTARMHWGAGGSSSVDTYLDRPNIAHLRVGNPNEDRGIFMVGGQPGESGFSGNTGDFGLYLRASNDPTAPTNGGLIWVDGAGQLCYRAQGGLKKVVMVP